MNQFPKAALRDLAPTGKLRAAINYGNPVLAQKDVATGQPKGVSVELARRLDMPIELVTFDAAGRVFEAIPSGVWDVAFLAIDPERAVWLSRSTSLLQSREFRRQGAE